MTYNTETKRAENSNKLVKEKQLKVLDKQLQNTLTQLERTTGVVQKIDKNSEQYLNVAKDSNESSDAVLLREIVNKVNEIVEWINNQ